MQLIPLQAFVFQVSIVWCKAFSHTNSGVLLICFAALTLDLLLKLVSLARQQQYWPFDLCHSQRKLLSFFTFRTENGPLDVNLSMS